MATIGMAEAVARRPMNSIVDLDIISKLAQKDLIALFQKCQGDKVSTICIFVVFVGMYQE